MARGIPGANPTPPPGSLLARWQERAPRESFICGVRVLAGLVPGEGHRWRYRRSAVDPLAIDGVLRLQHGRDSALRIRFDASAADAPGPLAGYRTRHAIVELSGALIQVSFPAGRLDLVES